MLFHRIHRFPLVSIRRRMIREHQRWLNRALRGQVRAPRIPVRPVSDGGFAPMLARPGGREQAAAWWTEALQNDE